MNVDIPEIPANYETYRAEVRTWITGNVPDLRWKRRTGLRTPDSEEDVLALRRWVRSIYDAGYAPRDGTSRDPFEVRILEQELNRTGLPFVLGNPLVVAAIEKFGSDDQRKRFLPRIASGEDIWTQLFSEPDAGSDLASLQTRGRLENDHYVVDGQKVWSTWAQWADFGYLLARTEAVPGPAGITALILDMHSNGIEVRPLREMTGTTDFNEVFLNGVRVPKENAIGEPGQGWKVATFSLASERSVVGTGGGSDPIRAIMDIARHSRRAGRLAIEDTGVRQEIGRLSAAHRIQRYLGYQAETKAIHGVPDAWDAPLRKIWFSERNLEMAQAALSLQGPQSILVEGDPLAYEDGRWQDVFLYARAWTIAGGSNEILRNLIAERGLGLPKEPRGREPVNQVPKDI